MIPAVIEPCAGIDAGKKFVAVFAMKGAASDAATTVTRKFGNASLARRGQESGTVRACFQTNADNLLF
jgi:hypothetical protein